MVAQTEHARYLGYTDERAAAHKLFGSVQAFSGHRAVAASFFSNPSVQRRAYG
jgi:hypothetical protein